MSTRTAPSAASRRPSRRGRPCWPRRPPTSRRRSGRAGWRRRRRRGSRASCRRCATSAASSRWSTRARSTTTPSRPSCAASRASAPRPSRVCSCSASSAPTSRWTRTCGRSRWRWAGCRRRPTATGRTSTSTGGCRPRSSMRCTCCSSSTARSTRMTSRRCGRRARWSTESGADACGGVCFEFAPRSSGNGLAAAVYVVEGRAHSASVWPRALRAMCAHMPLACCAPRSLVCVRCEREKCSELSREHARVCPCARAHVRGDVSGVRPRVCWRDHHPTRRHPRTKGRA
mmetsp:Transcript_16451/g.49324  ORF Transcript_16451/g.49324 Transcript_16451/m.49324 type:complete len:287 (-) Transcript_16451:30-890(-)